jgi:putative hydrolase
MAEVVSSGRGSTTVRARAPTNASIAAVLDEGGSLLEVQGASRERTRLYRRVAAAVRRAPRCLAEILAKQGVAGVARLTRSGYGFASAIAEIVATGRFGLLDALRGEVDPERVVTRAAGLGTRLVRRVEEVLGIVTLTELQVAALDGRLASVPGFGARRVRAVRDALAARLGGRVQGRLVPASLIQLSLAEVLAVDRQYRTEVEAGCLPRVAPGRGGGESAPSVPVLHTTRGARHYTALFAHTTLAVALDRSGDWVVVYAEDPRGRRQVMVVTETVGPHRGHRVVRGAEHESRDRVAARRSEPHPAGSQAAASCEGRSGRSLKRRTDALGGARRPFGRAPRSRVPRGPRRSPAPSPGVA